MRKIEKNHMRNNQGPEFKMDASLKDQSISKFISL